MYHVHPSPLTYADAYIHFSHSICGASIARAYTISHISPSDFSCEYQHCLFLWWGSLFHSIHKIDTWSDESTPSTVWSSVEISLGIICACLPTIQPILHLLSRKVRDATSSGSRQTEGRNRDREYGRLDEELATLTPAHANSKRASERDGVRCGTQETEVRREVPITAPDINENTLPGWGIAI